MAILETEAILDGAAAVPTGRTIGQSREGRAIVGHVLGAGPRTVSLIGGCHADEPVGPAMLERLVSYLAGLDPSAPLLTAYRFVIVPHVNPDGAARNASWTAPLGPTARWAAADPVVVAELGPYVRGVVREAPPDDVEFGFPRGPADAHARPENRAVAALLAEHGPLVLHGSFHGMAFAAGPWFLLERSWIDRTAELRASLRAQVVAGGYEVHDVDRHGEKGFDRIDLGFTTRPDSVAMQAHFEARGDRTTAQRFRPSSMECARSLGGDPLTIVSEMPLFVLPAAAFNDVPLRPPAVVELRKAAMAGGADELQRAADAVGLTAMPFRDQMAFQLAYLDAALVAVTADSGPLGS